MCLARQASGRRRPALLRGVSWAWVVAGTGAGDDRALLLAWSAGSIALFSIGAVSMMAIIMIIIMTIVPTMLIIIIILLGNDTLLYYFIHIYIS